MLTRKFLALCVGGTIAAGLLASPAAARGWGGHGGGWHGGWGWGFGVAPFYAPPPYYYYPPPVYYAPPVYAPPPAGYYSPYPGYIAQDPSAGTPGQSCNAGPYVCPTRVPVGTPCSCPGNDGSRVSGTAE